MDSPRLDSSVPFSGFFTEQISPVALPIKLPRNIKFWGELKLFCPPVRRSHTVFVSGNRLNSPCGRLLHAYRHNQPSQILDCSPQCAPPLYSSYSFFSRESAENRNEIKAAPQSSQLAPWWYICLSIFLHTSQITLVEEPTPASLISIV